MLALAALVTAPAAMPQAFGRFGYEPFPSIACLSIDKAGLSAKQDAADKLKFASPSKSWKPVAISASGETILLDKAAWSPQKVRFDLWAPGVSLYFPTGLRFLIGSTAAPYLTWSEGSVTNGVPTPTSKWLALSFRDNQPPIALGFPGDATALSITGKPGAWVVSSKYDYSGWVRVGCPMGTRPLSANSAAALGRLANIMEEQADLWGNLPRSFRISR
jgi:hypothetical protein